MNKVFFEPLYSVHLTLHQIHNSWTGGLKKTQYLPEQYFRFSHACSIELENTNEFFRWVAKATRTRIPIFSCRLGRTWKHLWIFPSSALQNPPYNLADSKFVYLRILIRRNTHQNNFFNILTKAGVKWDTLFELFFIHPTESLPHFRGFSFRELQYQATCTRKIFPIYWSRSGRAAKHILIIRFFTLQNSCYTLTDLKFV